MNHKRNELPIGSGAELILPPQEMKLGTYSKLTFDAKLVKYGVTWYRVERGFGGKGDREDWIADVPEVSVSVHDYHWNGEDFGPNYGTFDNACREELKRAQTLAHHKKEELEMTLANIKEAIRRLESLQL